MVCYGNHQLVDIIQAGVNNRIYIVVVGEQKGQQALKGLGVEGKEGGEGARAMTCEVKGGCAGASGAG